MHARLGAVSSRVIVAFIALCVVLAARPAFAQAIEAGRVVDDSTHDPLIGTRVMLQVPEGEHWRTVDSTRTDDRGFFQLATPGPGIYRIGLVGMFPTFASAPDTLAADSMQQREYTVPIARDPTRVYFEFQVDRPARASSPSPSPLYPSSLRSVGIDGEVFVQFVVNPNGRADITTLRVLRTSDPAFAESVREVLPKKKFTPGYIGRIAVRQMVQQTYSFNVGRPR